jgi:hypothetical protein
MLRLAKSVVEAERRIREDLTQLAALKLNLSLLQLKRQLKVRRGQNG